MNVSALLTTDMPDYNTQAAPRQLHPYPTRHASASFNSPLSVNQGYGEGVVNGGHDSGILSSLSSPHNVSPKLITFQALIPDNPKAVDRLPLRVNIRPGDSTEDIISTVTRFWGLYDYGITLEGRDGITVIARYENFSPDEVVYVRAHPQPENVNGSRRSSPRAHSPRKLHLDEPFPILPRPSLARSDTRSPARLSRTRHMILDDIHGDRDLANGMSDSDAGSVSVTSSRRAKADILASAEISLENIVEGGRRTQTKFESSQLPLFAPPQQRMPASMSSISPQRGLTHSLGPMPTPLLKPHNRDYPPPLPSPQSYGQAEFGSIMNGSTQAPTAAESVNNSDQFGGKNLRTRNSSNRGHKTPHPSHIDVLLPTPDPTIGSVVSDEDVALQLMRLGDPARFPKTRNSASTADETLSGKADAASSGPFSEEDDGADLSIPRSVQNGGNRRRSLDPSIASRKRLKTTNASVKQYYSDESSDEDAEYSKDNMDATDARGVHARNHHSRQKVGKSMKPPSRTNDSLKSAPRVSNSGNPPPSSYGHQQKARTGSVGSTNKPDASEDDADLSTKPRCQRCRKSKKGCDRQRPCQRCKDAGIGIEGCISEDEGNGRKGRYGRHMGVPLRKSSVDSLTSIAQPQSGAVNSAFNNDLASSENTKKRKR